MGARGKKRRRKDGSVATGKMLPMLSPAFEDFPLDPVPPAALLEAMPDNLNDADMSELEFEDKIEARFATGQLSASARIAERYDIDAESLDMRADKLTALLRERDGLHRFVDGAPLWIDPALLHHAASIDLRFNDELHWPG